MTASGTALRAIQGVTQRGARLQLGAALEDLRAGLRDPHLWIRLGLNDIRNRYRRSVLGPFWVSVSMAIYVAAIGSIWGGLFAMNARQFLPYLCAGSLVWNFLVGSVNEGCTAFLGAAGYIANSNRPLSTYAYWVSWRNILVLAHASIVYVLVALCFAVHANARTSLLIVTLPLLVLSIGWVPLLLGTLSARFRDLPQIAQSLMTVAFFVTPILWRSEQLGDRAWIAAWNPFTYLVEIVRAPLLGEPLELPTLAIASAIAVFGWGAAVLAFAWSRNRIAYWL